MQPPTRDSDTAMRPVTGVIQGKPSPEIAQIVLIGPAKKRTGTEIQPYVASTLRSPAPPHIAKQGAEEERPQQEVIPSKGSKIETEAAKTIKSRCGSPQVSTQQ